MSLNGCLTELEPNLEKYYEIAGTYKHNAVLVGSNTAKKGIETYLEEVPPETDEAFLKPEKKSDDLRPIWIIQDSKGIMHNLLHVIRQTEYCKDVIVLISKKTKEAYIKYLKKRNYDFIITGEDHVDIKKALEILYSDYNGYPA